VVCLINAIGHHNLVEGAGIDAVNSVTAQDSVCHQSIDFRCTFFFQEFGSAGDGIRRVSKIVY
jgi:hypothetical protein